MKTKQEIPIKERLSALRTIMNEKKIDAYLLLGMDPHQSEYKAPCWETRKWITGFSGSAGIVVVTADKAVLWTDSRYYIQAEQELTGSQVILIKQGLPGEPSVDEWLNRNLHPGMVVAAEGDTLPISLMRFYSNQLAKKNIKFIICEDILNTIWEKRPSRPCNSVFHHAVVYAGQTRADKIKQIRTLMKEQDCEAYLLSHLPDIAWVLNLRGNDIPYNPLFFAYLLIKMNKSILFLDPGKISEDIERELNNDYIEIFPYENVKNELKKTTETLLIDPDHTAATMFHLVNSNKVEAQDLTTNMKAKKNETEIKGLKNAVKKDGVALVKFMYRIEQEWSNEAALERIDEVMAAKLVKELRMKGDGFIGESFATISGFRDHGAIVHYTADSTSSYPIKGRGLLLLDSGAHYLDGTTDVTRVLCFGEPTKEEIRDYTFVLKGHISLAMAVFPEGTTGCQLDTLARNVMWHHGLNYGHSTGHGVGFFLNVHEGPQKITPDDKGIQQIFEGMITTNEPGLYRSGKHGIRIENMLLTLPAFSTEFGHFLQFETLTLCPYEPLLIDLNLLASEEINWLRSYNNLVYEELSSLLSNDERDWLKEKTSL